MEKQTEPLVLEPFRLLVFIFCYVRKSFAGNRYPPEVIPCFRIAGKDFTLMDIPILKHIIRNIQYVTYVMIIIPLVDSVKRHLPSLRQTKQPSCHLRQKVIKYR